MHIEVNGLIAFLRLIANREVGDTNDLNYDGQYCWFGLVIIGKPSKLLQSIEPYVGYIKKVLVKNAAETIYLLSRKENRSIVTEIAARVAEGDQYQVVRSHTFQHPLRYQNQNKLALQYLAVLRKEGVEIIQASVEDPRKEAPNHPAAAGRRLRRRC